MAGGHEQAVPFAATATEVSTAFWQQNAPEQGGVWRKDRDAILPWTAGEATPDIPLSIAPDAVRIETPSAILGVRGTTLAIRIDQ